MVYSAAYQKNAVRGNLEHMPREQTVKTEIASFYNSSFRQRKREREREKMEGTCLFRALWKRIVQHPGDREPQSLHT